MLEWKQLVKQYQGALLDNRVFRIRDEVAFRRSDDGTMTIVSPVTDKIVTINSSACEIWEMVDGKKTVSEIIEQFLSLHSGDNSLPSEKEVVEDVTNMIDDFFRRELIELV